MAPLKRKIPDTTSVLPSSTLASAVTAPDNWKEVYENYLVGQPEAHRIITEHLELALAGLHAPNRPLGIFLLLGPTGVGKTMTAQGLAQALHGHIKNMIRINCAEYQHSHEIARLLGAPPGYLGHRETNPVITQARLNGVTSLSSNISIILLDEFEKAHPSVAKVFLGIFDNGTAQLGDNTTVNFERTVFILTSNLGAKKATQDGSKIGFVEAEAPSSNAVSRTILDLVKRKFPPEFINRLDAQIVFNRLEENHLKEILERELEALENRTPGGLPFITITDAMEALLLKEGFIPGYGARPLRRALQQRIALPLSRSPILRQYREGEKILQLIFDVDATGEITVRGLDAKGKEVTPREKE